MDHRSNPSRCSAAIIALIMCCALAVGFAPRPAQADQAAVTRNIILGAAAVAAAIIINNNVQHKRAQANTVVGYTRDGGTVYANGRVVYPNGDVLYSSNGNGRPCTYSGYGNQCGANPLAYYPQGYNGHDHGHHYGQYKHHKGDRDDRGDRDDHRGDHDR